MRGSSGHNELSQLMNTPSVSVIIPAYNAGRTLRPCLQSVIATDYDGEVEIIVVDDGSSDDTCNIVNELGCQLIRRGSNGGPARARNAGAIAARGEVLFFLDADTRMRRDTIREAVHVLGREGVGAVTGMYEAEPINSGFFQRYYAYLKFHTFTASAADRITAFGGQCGAVYKRVFERVGGYRPIQWGMDIENEELGYRINQSSTVALGRRVRVGHNFPTLRKLLFVFMNRVYWWVLFRHFSGKNESVLMTRSFGYATAAFPAAALSITGAFMAPPGVGSVALSVIAAAMIGLFVCGYAGFWRFCLRRRGVAFMIGAMIASSLFTFVITSSAVRGQLTIAWFALRRRSLPFAAASLETA